MNAAQAISGQLNKHCVTYKSIVMDSWTNNRRNTFDVDEGGQVEGEKAAVAEEWREDFRSGDDTRSEQNWWEQDDEKSSASMSNVGYLLH